MQNKSIEERIDEMGLSHDAEFLLMLLPLVHVAWIDNHLHPSEARYIKKVAHSHGLSREGEAILEGWLRELPPHEYTQKGMTLLRELAQRGQGEVTVEHLQQLIVYSNRVAKSAGGLFNSLFKVSKSEKTLLNEIAAVFCVESIDWNQSGLTWEEIQSDLE